MNFAAYSLAGLGLGLMMCTGLAACQLAADTSSPLAISAPPAGLATETTRAHNAAVAERLPLGNTADFEDAARGLLAQIEADAILDDDGNIVWPIKAYDAITGDSPATVNPSLWRQAQLVSKHGLYEVVDGLYQVRGYDISVMSVIRGQTGWIIVDPLLSRETAAASLALVKQTLGERPVTGIIYTHSHGDHFGGVRGVIDEADAKARNVPILAPHGFTESAVAENLLAGGQMTRRAALMFGTNLPVGPSHHVSVGLGPALSQGKVGLIQPTEEIAGSGVQRTIDGITFEFMDANNTEAPAEFMFYLPHLRALCTAEVAQATFHNALTPRGAKIRDVLKWSQVIDEALVTYGDRSEVVFASHHWPTWGSDNIRQFLREQRDIYRYAHDQVLRRANAGDTIIEVAEDLPEPAMSAKGFETRGYYGTLNHNAKAVYQSYFGWWDGVPANFVLHPPVARAIRFVDAVGGQQAALAVGIEAFEAGDYRWASEVFNNVVFADPAFVPGREWLAAAYEQMGFQAESGTWRDYFLSGAQELRMGPPKLATVNVGNRDFLSAVPTRDLFDLMAARFNPVKLSREPFVAQFLFTDTNETISLQVGPSTAFPRAGPSAGDPAVTLAIKRTAFDDLVLQVRALPQILAAGEASLSGDPTALAAWFAALDPPTPNFNVVEP